MNICPGPQPLKKHLEVIARKIVEKYPQSFKDEIEGNVVGSGHDSLWKQLLSRVENCYRKIEKAPRKRPAPKDSSASVSEALEEARQQNMDSYGCINFNPTELPDRETEETLLAMKEEMKVAFKNAVHVDVDACMQKTFILQRRDIMNTHMSVQDVHKEWPFIFNKSGMVINFYQLVGIDIEREMMSSIIDRLPIILKYFYKEGGTQIQRHLVRMEVAENELQNTLPRIPGTLVVLMEHFGEELENLVLEKDVSSILTANKFMLAIDGCVVNDYLGSFQTALMMLFAAFFCLNVQYPEEAAATLDFIQRSLVRINPDKGCKTNTKKKKHGTHPKVLSLAMKLGCKEWRV
ncbi:hypothetical protein GQR58_015523 [Nymphon striatum]|nr:hypothetical protein GQR58_015523 [Nymphon striatum]